jgi:universal stress protein E
MQQLESIVVGVDFSTSSRVALACARRLAGWSQASVHAVHVITETADEMGETAREFRRGMVEDARQQWQAMQAELPEAGEIHLDIRVAGRVAGIREALERYRAGLLVIGAYGEGLTNVGMGTLASACIRSLTTDVLVVRETIRYPFRTVVVGIDFSDASRRALAAAAFVANGEQARLLAVHVQPARLETYARMRGDLSPHLQAFVAETTGRYPQLEVESSLFLHSGHRSGVLEFADQVAADLVVVGTRGQTNLRDVVLGSTAEKVLRDSPCAVWAAKPRATTDA